MRLWMSLYNPLHPFIFGSFWWWVTRYSDTTCIPGSGRPFRRNPLSHPPNVLDLLRLYSNFILSATLNRTQTPSNTLQVQPNPSDRGIPGYSLSPAAQDILKQLPSVNPRCEMKTIGDPLLNIQAGWMVPGLQNREVWSRWYHVGMRLLCSMFRFTYQT